VGTGGRLTGRPDSLVHAWHGLSIVLICVGETRGLLCWHEVDASQPHRPRRRCSWSRGSSWWGPAPW